MMRADLRDIYVISDLHLGGAEGFQIMRRPDALAAFIEGLARKTLPPKELVIAGDFVDFLAEGSAPDGQVPRHWEPLVEDASIAAALLNRIASRSSFAVVFQALTSFIQAGHRLTILLGNHDVELSYPLVRTELERALATDEGHGFRFIYDGEAYTIGDALIEHGNRYDRWNQVDHDSLRELRSLQSRGEQGARPRLFEPPAGSRLVANVMNPIKRDYSFVDLLKPENEAVLPILLALEPGYKRKILDAVWALAPGAMRGVGSDGIPVRMADASGGGASVSEHGASGDPLEKELAHALQGSLEDARAFLSSIDGGPRLGDASAGSITGGLLRILTAGDSIDDRLSPLLRALRALQTDRSFDVGFEPPSSPYLKAAERLGSGTFRYIVFGHTHHARRLTLTKGARYFNTGTWADLMRVPAAIFSPDPTMAAAALRAFVEALRQGNLDPYRQFTPTYVRFTIGADGRAHDADLHEASS